MAKKVIAPQKKIMSRSFLNSGTLIVITSLHLKSSVHVVPPLWQTVKLGNVNKKPAGEHDSGAF
jgi:hypothetical protein